ncbi:MAG: hypothetical protein QW346_01460 [Candidatus Micrarchaeaceae archaeon]
MNEKTRKLIAYLNVLGVRIDSNSFASRVKAQKLAYIIQEIIDKHLYTDFNFYIRGPYSRELAREYFDSRDDFVNGNSDYKVVNEEYEELERVKPLLSSLNQNDLEIVASLLFLRKERGLDENQAETQLLERKPHLKIEDIWRGSTIIKKLFLTEKLRNAIMAQSKKEIEEWDSLSNESLKKFE